MCLPSDPGFLVIPGHIQYQKVSDTFELLRVSLIKVSDEAVDGADEAGLGQHRQPDGLIWSGSNRERQQPRISSTSMLHSLGQSSDFRTSVGNSQRSYHFAFGNVEWIKFNIANMARVDVASGFFFV